MDVFDLRRNLVDSYANDIRSFIQIRDDRISARVKEELNSGLLWAEPLIQLNPSFEPGLTFDELVTEGVLHLTCREVFRIKKSDVDISGQLLLCEVVIDRHLVEVVHGNSRIKGEGENSWDEKTPWCSRGAPRGLEVLAR